MKLTTFVLRLQDTRDGSYAVAAMDLPLGTSLEEATELAIEDLDPAFVLERITNADTNESAALQSVSRAPKQGFGK